MGPVPHRVIEVRFGAFGDHGGGSLDLFGHATTREPRGGRCCRRAGMGPVPHQVIEPRFGAFGASGGGSLDLFERTTDREPKGG